MVLFTAVLKQRLLPAEGRLGVAGLHGGCAAVRSVGLNGEGLIPQGSIANAGMRRMTMLAGAGAYTGNGSCCQWSDRGRQSRLR